MGLLRGVIFWRGLVTLGISVGFLSFWGWFFGVFLGDFLRVC